MDILKNVILTEQGKAPATRPDCRIDISISAYIPEDYITSERTRIDIYKKIAAIDTEADFDDVFDELRDRFSKPPQPVRNLMHISFIRNTARSLGIYDIKQRADNLVFFFNSIDEGLTDELLRTYRSNIYVTMGDRPYVTLKPLGDNSVIERMEEFLKTLNEIKKSSE